MNSGFPCDLSSHFVPIHHLQNFGMWICFRFSPRYPGLLWEEHENKRNITEQGSPSAMSVTCFPTTRCRSIQHTGPLAHTKWDFHGCCCSVCGALIYSTPSRASTTCERKREAVSRTQRSRTLQQHKWTSLSSPDKFLTRQPEVLWAVLRQTWVFLQPGIHPPSCGLGQSRIRVVGLKVPHTPSSFFRLRSLSSWSTWLTWQA